MGRSGEGVLSAKEGSDCEELPLINSHKPTELLCVKIKKQINVRLFVAGVLYWPPDMGSLLIRFFALLKKTQAPPLLATSNFTAISRFSGTVASC